MEAATSNNTVVSCGLYLASIVMANTRVKRRKGKEWQKVIMYFYTAVGYLCITADDACTTL